MQQRRRCRCHQRVSLTAYPLCCVAAAVMPKDASPTDPAAVIATHALRALASMAAFENARAELARSRQLVSDVGESRPGWLRTQWVPCCNT